MKQQSLLSAQEYRVMMKLDKAVKAKKKNEEEKIQLRVCDYIRLKYPHVIFMCDLSSGMKMPIWIAARNKRMRSSRGLPDLFIAHPVGAYHGLFLELKKAGVKLYKKNARPINEHIAEQEVILNNLFGKGYQANFALGYEDAIRIIDQYLSLPVK